MVKKRSAKLEVAILGKLSHGLFPSNYIQKERLNNNINKLVGYIWLGSYSMALFTS